MQLSVEEARSQMLDVEQQLGSLKRERDEAQEAALLLQTSLDQLTEAGEHLCFIRIQDTRVYSVIKYSFLSFQEKQNEVRHNQKLLQSFKDQASQSAIKVCKWSTHNLEKTKKLGGGEMSR